MVTIDMSKINFSNDQTHLTDKKEEDKYRVIDRRCSRCNREFSGSRYQRWCDDCKKRLSTIYWENSPD